MSPTTVDTAKNEIRMPRPHPAQQEIIEHDGSAVVFAGRRLGKTQMGVYKIIKCATDPNAIGLYWWVGLSWRSASLKRAWRLLKYYARKIWAAFGQSADKHIRENEREIELPNGSAIWMRTAERPDSLAGEAVRGVVIDEFSLMDKMIWDEYIEATLLDYEGWALFIGVPKGENWAATLWRQAQKRKGWIARRYTTYDNPHMKAEKIDEIKANTPKTLFEQEYLALITPDAGRVFRGVRACATATLLSKPEIGRRYVAGLDFARENDYTAIVVMDVLSKQVVHFDHFNQVSWALQRARIKAIFANWRISFILAEANSIGSPNIELLQDDGVKIRAFTTTAQSKGPLIDELVVAFENRAIAIPNDELMIGELEAYGMERMPSGHYRYEAVDGMHDDFVIALALAWKAATEGLGNIPQKVPVSGLYRGRSSRKVPRRKYR